MAKNKIQNTQKKQVKKNKGNGKLIIIALAVIVLLAAAKFVSGSSSNTSSTENKNSSSQAASASPASITPAIEIKKDEITAQAKFYPYDAEGIKMEVLALKAKDGTIRTAFNTCQVCYASGKGYYVQEGDVLVCQNCGNKFASNMVGKTKGGCNPVPIPDASKVEDGSTIKIDKGFLDKNKAYFSNWKA